MTQERGGNERVHRYLDGEIPFDALTAEEQREVRAYEHVIEQTAAIRQGTETTDVTEAVMEAIAVREAKATADPGWGAAAPGMGAHEHTGLRRVWRWLWEPRPVRLRPAYPLGALAVLAALVMTASNFLQSPEPLASPAAFEGQVLVQFRLDAPDVSSVHLAGSFTDWEREYTLQEKSPGVWSVVIPLSPGVHDYAFVVDGLEWRPDPSAPTVDDGFGGQNSRLAVLLPQDNAS